MLSSFKKFCRHWTTSDVGNNSSYREVQGAEAFKSNVAKFLYYEFDFTRLL